MNMGIIDDIADVIKNKGSLKTRLVGNHNRPAEKDDYDHYSYVFLGKQHLSTLIRAVRLFGVFRVQGAVEVCPVRAFAVAGPHLPDQA